MHPCTKFFTSLPRRFYVLCVNCVFTRRYRLPLPLSRLYNSCSLFPREVLLVNVHLMYHLHRSLSFEGESRTMARLRTLRALLYKGFLVRRRFWKSGLTLEILVPLLLIFLVKYARDGSSNEFAEQIVSDADSPHPGSQNYPAERVETSNVTLLYAPNNSFTKGLVERIKRCAGDSAVQLIGFPNEVQLNNFVFDLVEKHPTNDFVKPENILTGYSAIVFKSPGISNETKRLVYTLRRPILYPSNLYRSPIDDKPIIEYQLLNLQKCVDWSFIESKTDADDVQLKYVDMPISVLKEVKKPRSDALFRRAIIIIVLFAFMFPLIKEMTYAADEKFIGVNVLMAMQGVPNWLNLLSWVLSGVIFNIVFISGVILLLSINLAHTKTPSFIYESNYFLLLLGFFLSLWHMFAFGYHVAMYFSRSLLMYIGLIIAYAMSIAICVWLNQREMGAMVPYVGIVFPHILLLLEMGEINEYEQNLVGLGFSNIMSPSDPIAGIVGSFGMLMIFSVIGAIVHFLMAVYIYEIHPGQYGVAKHPLFFLQGFMRKNIKIPPPDVEANGTKPLNPELFESVNPRLFTPGIQIKNLFKTYFLDIYHQNKLQALNDVSVNFYRGQITALLGKNGAGKSTLMSILTRMRSASSGSVFINGKDINEAENVILEEMGFCPQEDILFPHLSVYEQLLFFGMLKKDGKITETLEQEVNTVLKRLNLYHKRDCLPKTLSGGQRRRTCLAMALVGDASILILDEPTSGMDPRSRRDAWDVILGMRGRKTILISTHDMEEADILGDRIAIMDYGELRSYGTPTFLKKSLGHGNLAVSLSTEPWSDIDKIREFLDTLGRIQRVDGGKILLNIPNSPELPEILDEVAEQKAALGITGMSVSLITLEQVFLKVTQSTYVQSIESDSSNSFPKIELRPNGIQTLVALIRKKFMYTRRHWLRLVLMYTLPVLMVLVFFYLKNVDLSNLLEVKSRPINLGMYQKPLIHYQFDNEDLRKTFDSLIGSYQGARTKRIESTDVESFKNELAWYAGNNTEITKRYLIGGLHVKGENSTILWNNQLIFSDPILINLISNTLLRNVTDDQSYGIELQYGPPLHFAASYQKNSEFLDQAKSELGLDDIFLIYLCAIVFCACIFPILALFAAHPVKEQASNFKQLQNMAGASALTYWGSMFIVDIILFWGMVALLVITAVTCDLIYQVGAIRFTEIVVMTLILTAFAISVLPFTYLLTFTRMSVNGLVKLVSFMPFAMLIVEIIMWVSYDLLNIGNRVYLVREIQRYVFSMVPHLNFFQSNIDFLKLVFQNAKCRKLSATDLKELCGNVSVTCCAPECLDGSCHRELSYWSGSGKSILMNESLLHPIAYLLGSALIYVLLVLLVEAQVFKFMWVKIENLVRSTPTESRNPGDEQVRREKQTVQREISLVNTPQVDQRQSVDESYVIPSNGTRLDSARPDVRQYLVYDLHKRYGELVAVDQISFGVKKGQCFGLLGTNGAGKSTTFRMMTGDEVPNRGTMFMGRHNVFNDRSQYLAQISYCPQNHAILTSLNAYEHLRLFAAIRGIPSAMIDAEVQRLIKKLNLTRNAEQPSGGYSGGNKRRLNIGMSLIGNPNLMMLDEPTTGVDPAARRSLWNIIQSCQNAGQSIILTSHSMEECEVLCNRLGVMVKGELVCIGACEELKQQFSIGYDIEIKLNAHVNEEEFARIKAQLLEMLSGRFTDENTVQLVYHVSEQDVTWKKMYDTMGYLASLHCSIDDFTIQSSTLEQLFLTFAKKDN